MCCALILVMPVGWGLRYSYDSMLACPEGWDSTCVNNNFAYLSSGIAIEIILLAIVIHTSKKAFRKKEKVGI